ncbi:DUF2635 domain-containing protein [Pasteurellaceae bacterium HPA106]|uniref:DUF2635 domain-containing protein n=1 Tax=Spirabiliibacterium pneumoniae TaxID=221400 RepID=UPI001AAC57F0|nr:DUF2635 domain-containing protein [Spirabiliibacterium pneumoniae]MBE2895457.1 DUF2635 domain-containing protein [Spirabiliibacterium pneumoniae]
MKVKAAKGVKVPFEHRPHHFIEQSAVDVDETPYYLRRIADGDLIEVKSNRRNSEVENG